jgi:hypothetical protein
MAVAITSRSVVLTALNDYDDRFLHLSSLQFAGKSLVAGDRLTIVDGYGSVLVDHIVSDTEESKEFLPSEKSVRGLKLAAVPGGVWNVTAVND